MEGVNSLRVDADIADALKGDGEACETEELKNIFTEVAGENVTVKFDRFKDGNIPAILKVSEDSCRMEEMMRFYNMSGGASFPIQSTLILNTASPLISKLEDAAVNESEKAKEIASYIYKISLLSQKKFSADEMQSFMKDSFEILMKL